jgi:hypothetical protein
MCMRLFCVCVALCIGSGLATGLSLVQGVLLSVCKNDYGTEEEGPVRVLGAIEKKPLRLGLPSASFLLAFPLLLNVCYVPLSI